MGVFVGLTNTQAVNACRFGRPETLSAGRVSRGRWPGAVLIALISEDDPLTCTWLEAGFNHVLARPFDSRKLVELLEGKP